MRQIIATGVILIIATHLFGKASAQDNSEPLNIQYEVKKISISDDSIKLGGNQYVPALSAGIPESNAVEVGKQWGKKIRKKTKSKITQQHGVSFLYQTTVKKISPAPLNIYYSCFQDNQDTRLIASFEIDSSFISPRVMSSKYAQAYNFIRDFSRDQYKESVKNVLKGEKKKLHSVERDLQANFKKKEKLEKLIKNREISISSLENQIRENTAYAKGKTDEIISKRAFLAELTGEVRKQQEKVLKDLERDQKKIERTDRSIGRKITHYNANITKAKHSLDRNASEQELQKQRVQEQLSVVRSLEEKLNKIK